LAETPLPLEATLHVVPCRGGEDFLRRLFEPLGYAVEARPARARPDLPRVGRQPVLHRPSDRDGAPVGAADAPVRPHPHTRREKHYAIGDAEVEKLIRRGEGWLAAHPEKDAIVRRYLKHRRTLVQDALAQLTREDEPGADESEAEHDREEQAVERTVSLHEQRLGAVLAALKGSGAARVLDLGCGEGRLLHLLLRERQFTELLGWTFRTGRSRSRRTG
jgi:hypothetical protein